jgi:nucleotide-binding universal stress UspA family protein
MTTSPPLTPHLYLIVGYDGSPPARRALDAAVRLRQGRQGHITVVYVAHMASAAMLSAGAVAEMENDFDEVEAQLRTEVDDHLRDQHEEGWSFERREGIISDDLLAVAKETQEAHPDDSVVLVVGSSSHAVHRVVGSVAVSLARHSPVPVVVVP